MAEISKNDALFSQLVLTFQGAAWIQLGKVKNPQTNKVEPNLEQAQYSIDMLDMLSEKTEGNLEDEEAKILKNIIVALKMNYVEELEKVKKQQAQPQAAEKKENSSQDEKK